MPRRYGRMRRDRSSRSAATAVTLAPPNAGLPATPRVLLDEIAHLVDGADAAHVAVALRLAPGEQPVAAEDQAVAAGCPFDGALQHQRELESRPLPRDPDDLAAVGPVELLHLPLAVGAGSKGDRPVRMQMIDVRKRQEGVEGSVDRCRDAVLAERAERIHRDHLVLERLAAVSRDQAVQLVEIQDREAGRGDRTQIAAASLHRHDALRLAGERIGQVELRTGIAAAEIRDPKIRPEQVRTIPQQFERVRFELRRFLLVPEILQVLRFHPGLRHKSSPRIREIVRSEYPSDRRRRARSARPETIAR